MEEGAVLRSEKNIDCWAHPVLLLTIRSGKYSYESFLDEIEHLDNIDYSLILINTEDDEPMTRWALNQLIKKLNNLITENKVIIAVLNMQKNNYTAIRSDINHYKSRVGIEFPVDEFGEPLRKIDHFKI